MPDLVPASAATHLSLAAVAAADDVGDDDDDDDNEESSHPCDDPHFDLTATADERRADEKRRLRLAQKKLKRRTKLLASASVPFPSLPPHLDAASASTLTPAAMEPPPPPPPPPPTAPPPPTLSLVSRSKNSIKLTIVSRGTGVYGEPAIGDHLSYEIDQLQPDARSFACVHAGARPAFETKKQLALGTAYTFRARVTNTNTALVSEWSDALTCFTLAAVPARPDEPRVVQCTPHSIELLLPAPCCNGAPLTEYVVERADVAVGAASAGAVQGKTHTSVGPFSLFRRIDIEPELDSAAAGTGTGNGTGTAIGASTDGSAGGGHRLLVDRLAPATAHAFRFRVANAQGASLFSEPVTARTAAAAPRAPRPPCLLGGRSAARSGMGVGSSEREESINKNCTNVNDIFGM